MAWIFKEGEKPNILRELILTAVSELSEHAQAIQRGEDWTWKPVSDTPSCFFFRWPSSSHFVFWRINVLVLIEVIIKNFSENCGCGAVCREQPYTGLERCGGCLFSCELAPQMALALLESLCWEFWWGYMENVCLSGDYWKPDVFDKILINVLGSIENKI